MLALLIKDGEIVTADCRYVADIFCEGETITRIDRDLAAPARRRGRSTPRANTSSPASSIRTCTSTCPSWARSPRTPTRPAARPRWSGGTTTLIEMCCPARADDALAGFELWMAQAEGKSACDFTFHMGVTKFDAKTEAQLREIVRRGISSFKIFLAYKGAFGIDDAELYHTLKLAKELGVIVTAHCENETLVAERSKELLAAGKTDPGQHHESRPPAVEAEGVHHLMTFAELTGAATYIVHLSCQEALDRGRRRPPARRARRRSRRSSSTSSSTRPTPSGPNFEGAKYVMSPPLRDARNQAVLWNGLRDGLIQTVATDHAPVRLREAEADGQGRLHQDPQRHPLARGADQPALHLRREDREDRPAHVGRTSPAPGWPSSSTSSRARARSSPAPTPTWSCSIPHYRGTISAKTQAMNVDYSAFEGWKIEGRPQSSRSAARSPPATDGSSAPPAGAAS